MRVEFENVTGSAEALADQIRCPACGAYSLQGTLRELTCRGCGTTVSAEGGGYLDLLPAEGDGEAAPKSVAQKLMESDLFVLLYERVMRPFFVRVFAGPGAQVPGGKEEFALYRRLHGLDDRQGPWLDLSCGAGFITKAMAELAPHNTVVGVDISKEMLSKAAEECKGLSNLALMRTDVHDMPFADGTFSVINNAGSIHLYENRRKAMEEVYRMLRPGGTYLVSSFAESSRPLGRLAAKATGVHRTDLPNFPQYLADVGFTGYEQVLFGDVYVVKVERPDEG